MGHLRGITEFRIHLSIGVPAPRTPCRQAVTYRTARTDLVSFSLRAASPGCLLQTGPPDRAAGGARRCPKLACTPGDRVGPYVQHVLRGEPWTPARSKTSPVDSVSSLRNGGSSF